MKPGNVTFRRIRVSKVRNCCGRVGLDVRDGKGTGVVMRESVVVRDVDRGREGDEGRGISTDGENGRGELEEIEGEMFSGNLGRDVRAPEDGVGKSCAVREPSVQRRDVVGFEKRRAEAEYPIKVETTTDSTGNPRPRQMEKRTREEASEHCGENNEIGYVLSSAQTGSRTFTPSSISSGEELGTYDMSGTSRSTPVHSSDNTCSHTSITAEQTSSCEEPSFDDDETKVSNRPLKTRKRRKNDRGGQKLQACEAEKATAAKLIKNDLVGVKGDKNGATGLMVAGSNDAEELMEEHDGGIFVESERRGAWRGRSGAYDEHVGDNPKDGCEEKPREIDTVDGRGKNGEIQTLKTATAMRSLPQGVLPYPLKSEAISKKAEPKQVSSGKKVPQTQRPFPPGILPYPFSTKNAKRISSSEGAPQAQRPYSPGIRPHPFPTETAIPKENPGPGRRITNKKINFNRVLSHKGEPQARKPYPGGILPYPFPAKIINEKQEPERNPFNRPTNLERSSTQSAKSALPRSVLPYPFPTKTPTTIQDPSGQQRPTNHSTRSEKTPAKSAKRALPRGVLPYPFRRPVSKPTSSPYHIPLNMKKHIEQQTSKPAYRHRIPRGAMTLSHAENKWDRDIRVRQREAEERDEEKRQVRAEREKREAEGREWRRRRLLCGDPGSRGCGEWIW